MNEVTCPRCATRIPLDWKTAYCGYCSQWSQVIVCANKTCWLALCHPCLTRAMNPPPVEKTEYKPPPPGEGEFAV